MNFDMGKCLDALSLALDFSGMDTFRTKPNHARRVAYICGCLADELALPEEDRQDLYALALLHDNGATMAGLDLKNMEHTIGLCEHGEKNIALLPLQRRRENTILYQYENFDGSGPFKQAGEAIPELAAIIRVANALDTEFNLWRQDQFSRQEAEAFVRGNKGILFAPRAADAFLAAARRERFWCDMLFGNSLDTLHRRAPKIFHELSWMDIVPISKIFMKIVDSKSRYTCSHSSGVAACMSEMSDFYGFNHDKKIQLRIAAHLHDLGKLFISNDILEKPGKLDSAEMSEIRKHPYITKLVLDKIPGFEEVSAWAGNHHERLNGTGYPENLTERDLDWESRLLSIIDAYQAMTEARPYRRGMNHKDAIAILRDMASRGFMDPRIVHDVDMVIGDFASKSGSLTVCDPLPE